jgi:hypothetical protein
MPGWRNLSRRACHHRDRGVNGESHRGRRYGKRLTGALDAVSARLSSHILLFLGWRTDVAGNSVLAEARGWWLEHHGMLARPGG